MVERLLWLAIAMLAGGLLCFGVYLHWQKHRREAAIKAAWPRRMEAAPLSDCSYECIPESETEKEKAPQIDTSEPRCGAKYVRGDGQKYTPEYEALRCIRSANSCTQIVAHVGELKGRRVMWWRSLGTLYTPGFEHKLEMGLPLRDDGNLGGRNL